ncbi:MAG: GDP-mannose 4,6-dehydratase [Candidatus Latescibacteria bacterium]|nr:GDP-mannose 4,6-dehydratase [Candidatus Latescibacterota bacterium]MCB9515803.1 GDP-mannose 4,6-dehydratase [Candidatus Latescibacterota bacterium]
MKVLITGITGFAGSHLADHLLATQPDAEVAGLYRWRSRTENVEHLVGRVRMVECDIRDATATREAIEAFRPDYIFHLAAQSFVPSSWRAPQETLSTNLLGQLNVFEAVRKSGLECRIQIAGSSEEYGLVHESELPITEDQPLRPLSPYAVSKVGQDALAYQYFMSYGMQIIRTRGFNHTGPRRPSVFVCSDFARQVVEIERGMRAPSLRVGNLDARRDFTDVRDTVRGYWLALTKGKPGEVYNVATGRSWAIREVLDMLVDFAGVKVEIGEDPERLRPSDVPRLEGDATRLREATGWAPTIPFEQTLRDLLDYWRERLA